VPAAAVIPAPTAYINVVAVKKLVVEVMMCPLRFLGELPSGDFFSVFRHVVFLLFWCKWLYCRL
jgi:hypothetical protein